MSGSRHYPRGKPFAPPPNDVTPAAPPPPLAAPREPEPEKPRRRWKGPLLVLLLFLGLGTVAAWTMLKRSPSSSEEDPALRRLRELQHQWWTEEGTNTTDNVEPNGAFQRLLDQQRQWWDNENLAIDGNPDPNEPLDSLEQRERSWWERHGLTKGQAAPDRNAALAQLDHLSRLWWKEQKPTQLPDAATQASPPDRDTDESLSDRENTQQFLEAGGTEASEQAVRRGLKWLAAAQMPNGRWTPNGNPRRPLPPNSLDNACTALALLPFLAHGQTQRAIEGHAVYAKTVENGLNFLCSQQKPDGNLSGGNTMYVHALATIALCEAYVATSDPLLKPPCQKAIDFIVAAQHPRNGGWRYQPGAFGDLSVSSWCLMALKSGQMGGLHIPTKTIDRAGVFLRRVSRANGGYNYMGNSGGHSPPTPAVMTAAGIVCRQYLQREEDLRSPKMTRGVDILLANPPRENLRNFYYYYYATYALLPIGGDAWKQWNPKVRDILVGWQEGGERNPAWKGSWDPRGSFQMQTAGRVGVTALALLTLEVYYRHLPLNRPDLGEMAKPATR